MSRKKPRKSEVIITLSLVFFILFFSGAIIYKGLNTEEEEVVLEKPVEKETVLNDKNDLEGNEVEKKDGSFLEEVENTEEEEEVEEWRSIYPKTKPIKIGEVMVEASIASTISEQILGLSNTLYLPEEVVKFFMFSVDSDHPIWMKDMNYAIDIIWVTKNGEIVFIEKNVAPDSFPESFSSPVPARHVIEAASGFVSKNNIKIGDKVVIVEED